MLPRQSLASSTLLSLRYYFIFFSFLLMNTMFVSCTHHIYPNTSLEDFKMLSNKSYCQMYSSKCIIKLLINNPKLIDNLKITSTSTKIVRFKSIEWCGQRNLSIKIKKYCTFDADKGGPQTTDSTIYNVTNLYLVYVRCRLVGIKDIEFSFKSSLKNGTHLQETLEDQIEYPKYVHTIVIARPERFIDHILLGYVVFFSVVMSIIMGILLDIKTLLKIIQMPIPVLIGFCSQYLCMPLVGFNFCTREMAIDYGFE